MLGLYGDFFASCCLARLRTMENLDPFKTDSLFSKGSMCGKYLTTYYKKNVEHFYVTER